MSWIKRTIGVAAALLLGAAVVFAAALRLNYVLPILMYHSVHPGARPENRLSVSADSFERQMRFLHEHGYNVVPLTRIRDMLASGERIPPKTVAITLDDGYRDNFRYAFPILRKYNLPATVFVIVDEVGRAQEDRLFWEEIRQMHDSGLVTIGSHCMGPEPLINLTSEIELRRQIFESKRILEEKLGSEVTVFSYPEGKFDEHIRSLVQEAGYTVAVATNPGKEYPDTDTFALKRLRISATSDNLFVFWFESSGYYNFLRERRHR